MELNKGLRVGGYLAKEQGSDLIIKIFFALRIYLCGGRMEFLVETRQGVKTCKELWGHLILLCIPTPAVSSFSSLTVPITFPLFLPTSQPTFICSLAFSFLPPSRSRSLGKVWPSCLGAGGSGQGLVATKLLGRRLKIRISKD